VIHPDLRGGGTRTAPRPPRATAVVLDERGAVGTAFKADRPFLFFIRDIQTGANLFLGHVTDPR
jgi:serine protease inhibitor